MLAPGEVPSDPQHINITWNGLGVGAEFVAFAGAVFVAFAAARGPCGEGIEQKMRGHGENTFDSAGVAGAVW